MYAPVYHIAALILLLVLLIPGCIFILAVLLWVLLILFVFSYFKEKFENFTILFSPTPFLFFLSNLLSFFSFEKFACLLTTYW